MTSLAHQLKRLALPQNDPSLIYRKQVASLLFDAKEAAVIDRDTFFAIGCTGLDELMGIDSSFKAFEETLFSSSSKNLERSVQTKAINQQLDENITLFLTHLSPYFMLKPAQKCLEWLIHRFHIHLYNQDNLVGCVLPYHETKMFVRVIQLLKISNPTHKWHWLHSVQKSGVPLAKSTLVTHCYTDMGFMEFICSLVTKSVKEFSSHAGATAKLRIVMSFYVSSIVAALDAAANISDMLVAKLLPYIQKGLKTSLVEYKSSTFIIVCQLAIKSIIEPSLVKTLASQVSKAVLKTPSLLQEGVGCLIILLQNQQSLDIGKKPFIHLYKVPDLVSVLKELSNLYDISSFLEYLLLNLVSAIIHSSTDKADVISPAVCKANLEAILHNITLQTHLSKMVARAFLDEFLLFGERYLKDASKMAVIGKSIRPLIRLLETKYPQALDFVLEKQLKNVFDQEKQVLFHQFIALCTTGGKHELLEDSNTSLLLSLNHPQPTVRQLAVLHLKNIIETSKPGFEESFVKEAIIARLTDDNFEVLLSTLNSLKVYHNNFTTEQMVLNLLNLFYRADLSRESGWCKVLEEAVNLLILQKSVADHPQLCIRVMMAVLPHMLFTNGNFNSAAHNMAINLGRSSVCNLVPLLKGWTKALEDSLQRAKPESSFTAINMNLARLISSNITGVDSSFILQMVENLVQLEKNAVTVRQKLTFYVLSYALVEGYSQCQDPGLQFAKIIFEFLEKKLRKLESSAQIAEDNWLLNYSNGEQLHELLLTKYIDELNAENSAEMLEAVLLMLMLKIFIKSLRRPKSFPRGILWWNPETVDIESRKYLQVLFGLFDVIVWGASDGIHVANFRTLLGLFFKEHLKDPAERFGFLSLMWTYCYSLTCSLGCMVNAVLQTQALYIGQSLLASETTANKKQLTLIFCPVVVSLLINLTSPVKEVRKAAMACLNVLSIIKDSPLSPVIQGVLEKTEEIVADSAYVSQILGNLFTNAYTSGSSKAEHKLSDTLHQLLHILQTPGCPSYVGKVLLVALRDVNSEDVLIQLLPVLERLLEKVTETTIQDHIDEALLLQLILGKFNKDSASLLSKNQQCLDILIQVLKTPQTINCVIPSLQIVALGQINKEFFAAIDDGCVQQKLLGVMFDLLVDNKNSRVSQVVTSVFKSISINAGHISSELEPYGRDKGQRTKDMSTVRQTRRSKIRVLQKKPMAVTQEEENVNWPRTTIILELLQHKKKLKEPQLLIHTLFDLLSRCLQSSNLKQENFEYTKQLILSCLHNICQKALSDNQKNAKDILDEEKFNVELIVQCVRTSEMPQTHHQALLLLGTAAEIFPEKVLHNIMPIFTFMGANVMRLDDRYSFQVISKTVQTVIPSLIQAEEQSCEETRDDVEKVVGKIIHVFVDALPYVAEHRRLPILSQLLDIVGAGRFLWVLLVFFFEQHVSKSVENNKEKDIMLERDTAFWITVCCEFSVYNQLESLIKLVKFLAKLPENNEDLPQQIKEKTHEQKPQKQDIELFNLDIYPAKQLRHFRFLSVSFITQLLAHHGFISKIVKCEAAEDLRSLEQRLLEEVLCYINLVTHSVEANADKPTAKFWRVLLNKTYECLDKVNSLLPTEIFIPVLRGLLSNQLSSVRRKALDILNNKLQHQTQWQEEQIEFFLGLVTDLLCIAQRNYNMEEEEHAINRQTALYSLMLLCKCFGSQRQQVFVPVISVAVDITAERPKEKNILGSALLCIAEITSTVKALAIPQLPRLMTALLSTLKQNKELLASEVYLLSTLTALQKVIETLPHFISPYLYETLLQVTLLDKIAGKVGSTSQISLRISALKTTLSTSLTIRVLLPTISKCYCHLVDTSQQQCISSLMDIMREHIAAIEKLELSAHQSEFTCFFLKALDYRVEHSSIDLLEVDSIEGHIINCLVTMIMKLSEATFRPLFFKLFDWCRTEGASKERLITFYRLADCIADKLKGLFTLFAGHLIKPFAEILNQTNTMKTDEAFFDCDDNSEKSCLLLEFVLRCLHKIFLYDNKQFLSKERADALMMPLLDQIENLLGGDEKFQSRVNKSLVPCIAQFSVAMADDSLWKPLNYQILLKMRHSSAKVRFAALLVLVDLVEKLRENYLALLPESIPFLAELMEGRNIKTSQLGVGRFHFLA
ncbi:HEAT repeat-containing protein 1 isoform X2 [Pyxicephalus adspersus]